MSEPAPVTNRPASPADDTLGASLRAAVVALRAAGLAEPADEARRLVALATGWSSLIVATEPERHLSPAMTAAFADSLRRRAGREPLARIAGWREFYGRRFALSAATLEPRADTETVVDAALEVIRAEGWQDSPLRILDVGTGTGCLLLTLLAELPHASGLATDISDAALATAADNALALGLAGRAAFRQVRSLSGIDDAFDLVVSNPPYIRSGDIAGLDPEVRVHDPLAALDGGADGLDIYREMAERLPAVCPAGWCVVEVGAGQADDVLALLAAANWLDRPARRSARRWLDLSGHTRVVAIGPRDPAL